MGIKLEWQVESSNVERNKNRQHNEDPDAWKRRWRAFFRLVLFVAVFLGVIACGVWLVSQRLNQVDTRQKQLLENTVSAEVAALRVGEEETFMNLQRSATNDWIDAQAQNYDRYQTLKAQSDINLTGRVLNSAISGQRGRVQIEEIESGVPYVRTWFYWNYDTITDAQGEVVEQGGWHHVPPDYTFWGEPQQTDTSRYSLRYQALDAPFAQALQTSLTQWFEQLCAIADCTTLPFVTIDVVANPNIQIAWAEGEAWQLLVSSPYISRARADMPFDSAYQINIATLVATRATSHLMVAPSDVYDAKFFRTAFIAWLVGRWVQLDTQAYLLESVARQYGESALGNLLKAMQPNSDLSLLVNVLGITDITQANLDWRDFVTWRLQLEANALINRDQDTYLRLYDTSNDTTRQSIYDRFSANLAPSASVVVSASVQTTGEGVPQLFATLNDGTTVLFRWVNNNWLRAS
jgi:hypothetical protein